MKCQQNLAKFEAGKYEEAETIFAKELQEGAKKAANAAYNLGNIKLAQLEFKEALKYYLKAAEEDPKSSLYLNEVGFTYYTLGKYQKAINYYQQALAIGRKVYGEKHPWVATYLNNLGEAWRALGKYKKAIDFYQRALVIWQEVYGEKHPQVSHRLKQFGSCLVCFG